MSGASSLCSPRSRESQQLRDRTRSLRQLAVPRPSAVDTPTQLRECSGAIRAVTVLALLQGNMRWRAARSEAMSRKRKRKRRRSGSLVELELATRFPDCGPLPRG
jgi:hypothetical protein